MTVRCPQCHTTVERVIPEIHPDPVYCSPVCKRRAAKARARRRAQRLEDFHARTTQSGPLCPTPYKRSYATWELATETLTAFRPPDPTLQAYRCTCGAIHLGH